MPEIIRALSHRSSAPQFECADGRVVQTRYYDAETWPRFTAWEQSPGDPALFLDAVQAVVPDLDTAYIDQRLSFEDCNLLIAIGKGNADAVRAQIKNSESDGGSPTPSRSPGSSPTTPS